MQLEITSGRPWDFSHAPSQIIDVVEKQDCNIFLYGFPLSSYSGIGHQAPVYAGILMPPNAGPPTNMLCVGNNQNTISPEQFVSFDECGYSWQQSEDPDHNGQVYFLACSKDFGSMSEEDSYRYEYGNLFMLYPELLSTNRDGKLNVECVHLSFRKLNGDLATETWHLKEKTFAECIDDLVFCFDFDDEDELKEAGYETDEEQQAKLAQVRAELIQVSLSKSYPVSPFDCSKTFSYNTISLFLRLSKRHLHAPAINSKRQLTHFSDRLTTTHRSWVQLDSLSYFQSTIHPTQSLCCLVHTWTSFGNKLETEALVVL